MTAITADTIMKNTMKILMIFTRSSSLMSFLLMGLITSSVKVELDVSTSDESVDMDAESTSTITTAMTSDGRVASIAGTMESNSGVTPFDWYWISSAYSLPKPPRK